MFATAASAALAVAGPATAAYVGIPILVTPAIVGGLYPLLPGGALVASVTDGLSGTPLSAMAKGLQASVTAVGVALGALGALLLVNDLGIVDTTSAPPTSQLVIARQRIGRRGGNRPVAFHSLPTRSGSGCPGHSRLGDVLAVPQAADGFPTASFFAAVVIGAGGQVLARVRHTSASVYTTTSVFVLVPGFTIYLSMVAFAAGRIRGRARPADQGVLHFVGDSGGDHPRGGADAGAFRCRVRVVVAGWRGATDRRNETPEPQRLMSDSPARSTPRVA